MCVAISTPCSSQQTPPNLPLDPEKEADEEEMLDIDRLGDRKEACQLLHTYGVGVRKEGSEEVTEL